ncbi:MAG: hypothetical protein K2X87_31680, partial [Gemmataceae bacterium]|nr:hypothetical protein [Gemmataceae bacterium]
MRQRFIGGALLAAAAVAGGADDIRAQGPPAGPDPAPTYYELPITARGQIPAMAGSPANAGFDPPVNADPAFPIPTGRAGAAGFYTAGEFILWTQSKAIGQQDIAFRGFVDSTGEITGIPGTYVGSGKVGLRTDDLGRTSFTPGYRVELGYKFEDGTRIYANYAQLFETQYSAGATLVPPFFRSRVDLADTYLVAGVYNFPPQFAGPARKTLYDREEQAGLASNTYGIWNAASVMDIKFTQRFSQAEIGGRVPMFQTDYSRVYGLAGGRFAWFFERFQWRTVSYDIAGRALPQDVAWYTNTLSQRMYGPFVGCGHEIFLHNSFSLSTDLTAAGLLAVEKERVKYKQETFTAVGSLAPVQAKRGVNEYSFVPNANADINLWWYPVEGVQVRVGYSAMTFFNTRYMREPVGFNYGAIDPEYDVKVFRIVHGINF